MRTVKEVIAVEGRYDKNTLSQVVDAVIIETRGFGVCSDGELLELLRRMALSRGLIILTDSDAAGFMIRGKILGAVDNTLVKNAYIPDVYGRERRKSHASREGKLGVEGMPPEVLMEALERAGATFLDGESTVRRGEITKADLYSLGLCGTENCSERRAELKRRLKLPERLSANALLDVLNALYTLPELKDALAEKE